MLIINRKREGSIKIGDNIEIKILGINAGDKAAGKKSRTASIGIEAPKELSILRKELIDTRNENVAAANLPESNETFAGLAGLLKKKKKL